MGGDPHPRAALDRILAKLPSRKRGLLLGVVSDIAEGHQGLTASAAPGFRRAIAGRVLQVLPEI